jgi:CubicO group peptidase (beta-lactamase class C family)
MKFFKTIVFTCLLVFATLGHSTPPSFDDDLRRFASSDSVGYSVLISQNGKVVYKEARGLANIELNVPMKSHHIFEIGSLTKQFTAVAILLLAQDGVLSLEDNISKYIPSISTTKSDVTLRHLLSHTSGLVDPINDPEFLETRIQENVSLDALISQFKNGRWQHVAGEQMHYSNVGYSMLALVIEKVSGLDYKTFLNTRIFEPLDMHNTSKASFNLTSGKVTGYTFDGNDPWQHDFVNLNWAYGAADLLSTTEDLSLFTHALMQGKVLNKEHLHSFLSPVLLNDGAQRQGSFTYSLSPAWNVDAISTSGSTLGYSSHSIYLPNSNTFVVVLSNSDGVNGGSWIPPATVAGKLTTTLLAVPIPDYKYVPIPDISASRFIGNYEMDKNTLRKLSFDKGHYFYQRNDGPIYPVIPMGENSFYFKDTLSHFKINKPGTAKRSMDFYNFLNSEPDNALLVVRK